MLGVLSERKNELEDQGEGVRGRNMGIEECTGKEIGGCINANATMDVWSYEAGQDQK